MSWEYKLHLKILRKGINAIHKNLEGRVGEGSLDVGWKFPRDWTH